jgi:hypothetical protein
MIQPKTAANGERGMLDGDFTISGDISVAFPSETVIPIEQGRYPGDRISTVWAPGLTVFKVSGVVPTSTESR